MIEQTHRLAGKVAVCLAVIVVIAGCSNRAWYEGIRSSNRHECLKTQEDCPPAPEYEQYKQQREELNKGQNQR